MNLANQIKDLTTHWNMAQESGIVLTLAASGRVHLAFGDDKLDQRDLLFQCVARLERTARKAEESGNYACVIGCVAQLNKMMALGADQKGFRG